MMGINVSSIPYIVKGGRKFSYSLGRPVLRLYIIIFHPMPSYPTHSVYKATHIIWLLGY